ncbi:SHOCT domain-containing protein [Halorussus sp. MSC15.2]|uniref:SHOCT domain-containing protein n=1 Tax=Halorussus sp. MSC15.2 TaxID=2283638 RepID=UPI0013D1FCA7|nr:SHOCT domain-containing protein [Halorussus sp. MSC15.2]NEU57935.1 SHOCT domain-containing protein [Halorussus sp. MSC15.2]
MEREETDIDNIVEAAKGDSVGKELLTDSGKVRTGLLSKSKYRSILSHLDEGEQPHFIERYEEGPHQIGELPRYKEGWMKTTVVTDRRVFFYSTEHHYGVPFEKISEIRTEDNLTVIHSGGQKATFPMFPSRRQSAAEHIRQRMYDLQGGASNTETTPSTTERLAELSQMHDEGLIDDAEYERKKKEMLDDL